MTNKTPSGAKACRVVLENTEDGESKPKVYCTIAG